MNANQPIADRVKALMAVMTPDEKAMQLNYECAGNLADGWNASSWQGTSIGVVGIECSGYPSGANMSERISFVREYQLGALKYSRLGIPVTFTIETSHCGAAGGTIFPMGVTQGASWNVSLVSEVQATIALEARAWGGDRGLSPEINVVTDPRFGRTEENFGEEPLLVSRMAEAAVIALQGGRAMPTEYLPDPTSGIVAEAKHCCVYGYSGLDGGAADVSEKTLHDVYLKPWRAFIRAGGRGMMMSHNDLNGLPMHANYMIMKDLFRNTWNYTGFFASDWGNIRFLVNTHLAANETQAAALAISAGVDQAFVDSPYYPGTLNPAIASGIIAQADVDRAVYNMLASKFAAGLFDGAIPNPENRAKIYTDQSRDLARRAAAESAVLLTNKGGNTLPLALGTKYKKVALIGPNAGCSGDAGGSTMKGPPSSSCVFTPATDCDGNDIDRVTGITTQEACCALCSNNSACNTAVLATDANICLLKTACSPSPNPARIRCDPGKPPPPQIPWTCKAMRAMLGGYSNLESNNDALADNHAHVVTVLEAALAGGAKDGYSVSYEMGVAQQGFETTGIAAAVALANSSDVAVLVLGDGGESVGYDSSVSCGEGADRPSLDLPGVQLDLLSSIIATGIPTIVVLIHGRPVTFGGDYSGSLTSKFGVGDGLDALAGALVAAWRPGCEGGGAIWDIITGVTSPSGRLAQSWPLSVGSVRTGGISPAYIKFTDQGGSGYTLGAPFRPAYPLGHGLDFLSVSYGASSATLDTAAQCVHVDVTVNNAAPREGAYVVQVYFTQALSKFSRYQRILGGFEKVWLPANGSLNVTVDVTFEAMAYYDPISKGMVLEASDYTLFICSNIATCSTDGLKFTISSTITNL